MLNWKCILQLQSDRKVINGSTKLLCDAIRKGADLRIHTDFRFNEHIDVTSGNSEMVNEVSEFAETCILNNNWVAGFMTLRQPVTLPDRFGRPSMSFFLYNQDGTQAIARPYLDDLGNEDSDTANVDQHNDMPKYHVLSTSDDNSNAPSRNFVFDFEVFRFFVQDNWQEIFSNETDGTVISGSLDALIQAFMEGSEVKVGIRGLFYDLADTGEDNIENEVFIKVGWGYNFSEQKLFVVETHPLVRVKPAVPLLYRTKKWDFGWLILRTDGFVIQRLCNPYTLKFTDVKRKLAIRWFIR